MKEKKLITGILLFVTVACMLVASISIVNTYSEQKADNETLVVSNTEDEILKSANELEYLQKSNSKKNSKKKSKKVSKKKSKTTKVVLVKNKKTKRLKSKKKSKKSKCKKKYLGTFKITGYCGCTRCCGKNNGITASGTKATAGRTIAADTSMFAFGTELEINGHTYKVEDRGGAVNGNHIDMYFNSHSQALDWGVRYCKVYIKK